MTRRPAATPATAAGVHAAHGGPGTAMRRRGVARLAAALAGALGVLTGAAVPLAAYVAFRASPPPAPAERRSAVAVEPRCDPPSGAGAPARCDEILAFLGAIRAGTAVDRWRIVRIDRAPEGAISVAMAGADGRAFTIEVRRRDPAAPSAPAQTEALSLYLARVEVGSATPEDHGLAARALAARLAEAGRESPPWLRPLGGAAPPRAGRSVE